jgi:hypothetical protein
MEQDEETVEVAEERLFRVRGALSNRVGALMRAWWMDMFTVEDEEEGELYAEIAAAVGSPSARRLEGSRTPLAVQIEPPLENGITRLSDEDYLAVFDQLMLRLELLRRAYERGMIVAETREQEEQLERIHELFDRRD